MTLFMCLLATAEGIYLGAEKSVIAAEKTSNNHLEKIAVKIKSFISKSDLNDFEGALLGVINSCVVVGFL